MMGYAVSCNRISISRMSNGLLFTIALELFNIFISLFRYQYNNLNFEMSLPTWKPPAYWFISTDGFLDWHIVAFQAERTKVHGPRYMVHTTKLSQRLLSNKCQLQSIWRQLLSMYVCVGTGVCSANAGVCGWLYTHTHTYVHTYNWFGCYLASTGLLRAAYAQFSLAWLKMRF